MIHAEVALYPLKTANASQIITSSLSNLNTTGIQYNVGSMNTHLHGNPDEVWGSLQSIFEAAQGQAEVSMVITVTNVADH